MELLKSVKAREEGRAGVNTAMTDVQKQPKQVKVVANGNSHVRLD